MDWESIEVRGVLVALWLVYLVVLGIWIVLQKRDPAATLSWIFSLALLPYVGFVIFYVFGPRRIKRNRSKRLASYKAISDTFSANESLKAADSPHDLSVQLTEMVERATGIPLSTCRAIRLLVDGAEKYDAVCEAVAKARHHVHLEYYTYAGDESGTRIRDELIAAAKRGVQVRLVMDGAGSFKTRPAFLAPLRAAGAEVAVFHSMFGLPRIRPMLNFRSNRKIVVVDGVIGFTGGINVTDDENERVKPDTYFRDVHARLEGDAVAWMQRVFLEDWHYTTGKLPKGEGYFVKQDAGRYAVQIMPSGPDNAWEPIHRAHLIGIHSANSRVWLVTPYFVPTEAALYALTSAALRGLDVRVMVPKKSDSRLVDMAARSYFDHLVEAGVRVLVYQPRMLHSKALLIDDSFAILGSSNFDARSFRTNFELSIAVHETEMAKALEKVWATDAAECIEIKPNRPKAPFVSRLGEATARLGSPLL